MGMETASPLSTRREAMLDIEAEIRNLSTEHAVSIICLASDVCFHKLTSYYMLSAASTSRSHMTSVDSPPSSSYVTLYMRAERQSIMPYIITLHYIKDVRQSQLEPFEQHSQERIKSRIGYDAICVAWDSLGLDSADSEGLPYRRFQWWKYNESGKRPAALLRAS